MTVHRAQDYQLIADTAANKEAIINIKEDMAEMRDDIHSLNEKMDAIIKRLDANTNQILGASKFAKFLWLAFPTACAGAGWLWGRFG